MENPDTLARLFRRFLNKESSPEELQQLFEHFGTADDAQLRSLIFKEMNDPEADAYRDDNKMQHLLAGINKRIDHAAAAPKGRIWKLWLPPVAAAVVLLALTYLFLLHERPKKMLTVSAAYGEMKQITLPDSTHVWLNAGTTLRYPETFTGKKRTVEITDGQVFFEVTHDADKPFIVHTQDMDVSVLGTSFEVKSFRSERQAKVTVNSGKVGVVENSGRKAITYLLPNQQGILDRQAHRVTTASVSPGDIASWRDNKLTFIAEDLTDVLHTLERRYAVKIMVRTQALQQEKITLRLDNEPLETVMQALSFSNHFKYQKNNDGSIIIE